MVLPQLNITLYIRTYIPLLSYQWWSVKRFMTFNIDAAIAWNTQLKEYFIQYSDMYKTLLHSRASNLETKKLTRGCYTFLDQQTVAM